MPNFAALVVWSTSYALDKILEHERSISLLIFYGQLADYIHIIISKIYKRGNVQCL